MFDYAIKIKFENNFFFKKKNLLNELGPKLIDKKVGI